MHGNAPDGAPFLELDHAPAPEAWWPDISKTILELAATLSPIDRTILAPLTAYLERHGRELRRHAANTAPVKRPEWIHDRHPGSATLFGVREGGSAGLEQLTCIGLCTLIEASKDGLGPPKQLLSIIRGVLKNSNSAIPSALGAISSIPELVRLVEKDEDTRKELPAHFLGLWNSWLRDTLTRWMLADPLRLRNQLEPLGLVPQLEDPQIQISTSEGQDEGGATATCLTVQAFEPGPGESAAIQAGRAASDQMERASVGDLLAPAEYLIPRDLDERLCRETVFRARQVLDSGGEAEPYVALALLLAGCVREIDLRDVIWGAEGSARPHAIDPTAPVLYRRLKLPANAAVPDEKLRDWLAPHSDTFAWPLSPKVHALLLALTGGKPTIGDRVLPRLAAGASSPYRMRDIIKEVAPEARVGALVPRMAFAANLASTLGTEMAQLSMADTFGKSSIPVYYGAMPEGDLATVIAEIQSRRFGELIPIPADRLSYVGSRLVLINASAQHWPASIRTAQKRASLEPDSLLVQWLAHRDKLAAVLCSATGHRPEDVLGRILLSDVIPEYGLVILQDKQVDALRANRVAATGKLWLADLRLFLDRLIQIAQLCPKTTSGVLAAAILKGEAPLFSVPTSEGKVAPMTAAALRQGMPEPLQCVDNFFRHRLAQQLIARRVEPELRHAQLGWIVSAAHLHADLSPRSAVDLGRKLGPVIDELLVADGWYLPSDRRTRWTWAGVPMPAAVDWTAAFATQKRQQEEDLKRIRLRLREQWKALEPPVLARLRDAFQEFCPLLRIDEARKCLIPRVDLARGIGLSADQHALMCDRVRLGDQDPASGLEAVIARILLYRMVRNARGKGLVVGPIPSRPYLSVTSDPSPFVPGLGIAVRQAHAIRRALETHATRRNIRDHGQLTTWSILAFSMYRKMSWARAATSAARYAVRARGRRQVIRINARVDDASLHMVFSGAPAALLLRRKKHAPTSPAPPEATLEAWAIANLSEELAWGEPGQVARRIEETLAAAGQIERSGIEHWLVNAGTQTAAESPHRCAARDDDAPIRTADLAEKAIAGAEKTPPLTDNPQQITSQRHRRDGYTRFANLLNKRAFGRSRASGAANSAKASDGKHQWRRALHLELVKFRQEQDGDPNLQVLIGYTLDHLQHGSEDGNVLGHASLRREISQFAWPLLVLLGERSLIGLSGEELRRLYREVLLAKAPEARPYAFEEIQRFQRFLVRVHTRPPIDLSDLAALAGTRGLRIEPGLLTPAERRATADELRLDHESEAERADANPDFLRLTQLRRVFFLILEAAGIRPGSAYGLTLGDLHFLGDRGDVVHVRTTGEFGEAKSHTSVGFFLLEGDLWNQARDWVQVWIRGERECHPAEWRERPLFASKAGAWTRVHEHHLTARIGALMKWASGNSTAHCYWLRKTRISERFDGLWGRDDLAARDVYGAMLRSGHAAIHTTIERYINDPATLLFADLSAAAEAPRSLLLAMSSLAPGALDMAWSRAGGDRDARSGILLDRLGDDYLAVAPEHRTTPPVLRRAKSLLPTHIDAYARAMHRYIATEEAVLAAGITMQQADQFNAAAAELITRRGLAPWRVSADIDPRAVLPVPRRIAGSERWFSLLERTPSTALLKLAENWVGQPHIARRFGEATMVQIDQSELLGVHELLSSTGLRMQVVSSGEYQLLTEKQAEGAHRGHSAALRWVLAIVWIYAQRTDC